MIYLASDHAGFATKTLLTEYLKNSSHEYRDLGPFVYEYSDDYVDYATKVCEKVQSDLQNSKGILVCGSGEGMMITANKYRNIYAALCNSSREAVLSRQHNNTNVLVISQTDNPELIYKTIVVPWLETEFSNAQRHIRRIEKIKKLEDKFYK